VNTQIGNLVAISIKCRDCGKDFVMGKREINWYSKRGWTLPKRCESCRKVRRKKINDTKA